MYCSWVLKMFSTSLATQKTAHFEHENQSNLFRSSMSLSLICTPRSHFARKIRILCAALNIELKLIDVGNASAADPSVFGPNPLMKVPTLLSGKEVVFDSDNIAQYIVRSLDPLDEFDVLRVDTNVANARVVMNGVMSADVEFVMARRTGIDTTKYIRFSKHLQSIKQGLQWLDANESLFHGKPSYTGFHLVSMWDHIELYGIVPLLPYSNLALHVNSLRKLKFVSETVPPPL
jgi:hypothetical protein